MILRMLGNWLVLAALIVLIYDATKYLETDVFVARGLADHIEALVPGTLAAMNTFVAAQVHPLAWTYGIGPLMSAPAWLVVGALAALCLWLGRRRHRINVFAN